MLIDFTKELFKQAGDAPDQTLIGSTRAGGGLALDSTTAPVKGTVMVGRLVYDGATGNFGNVPQPAAPFDFAGRLRIDNSADSGLVALEVDRLLPTLPSGSPVAGLQVEAAGQTFILPLYALPVGVGFGLESATQQLTARFRWKVMPPHQSRTAAFRWNVAAAVWPADTFTRDSYPMALDFGTSTSGHRWRTRIGAFQIVSGGGGGRVRRVSGGPVAAATIPGQQADGVIETQLFGVNQQENQGAGLLWRYDETTMRGWTLLCEPAPNYSRYLLTAWDFREGRWIGQYRSVLKRPAEADTLRLTLRGLQVKVEVKPLGGNFHTYFDEPLAPLNAESGLHGIACSFGEGAASIRFGHYSFTPL